LYPTLPSPFLGAPLQKNKHYHIVGGGIAGLLMGYWLKKAGQSFNIYEKTARVGGLLNTSNTPFGIAEHAANGVLWTPAFQELCEDIALPLLSTKKASKNRFIVRNKTLHKYPLGFSETLVLLKNLCITSKRNPFVTIKQFSDVYLSNKVSAQLLEPALAGIYAAELDELSFPAVLPSLATLQSNNWPLAWQLPKLLFSGRKKAPKHLRGGILSFKGGMQSLVNALEQHLKAHIFYNVDGQSLNIHKAALNERYILCTPAHISASFFEQGPVATLLSQVKYASIISSTLFFNKAAISNLPAGFGCLIPRNEGLQTLGILFNHHIYPHRINNDNIISLTCIVRDTTGELIQLSNDNMLNLLQQELRQLFTVKDKALHAEIHRWPNGIPIYSPQLHANWFHLQQHLQNDYSTINLLGNYTGKISIRQMCATIAAITKKIG